MPENSEMKETITRLNAAAIGVVMAPGKSTLITQSHPLPELDRATTSEEPEFDLFHFGFSICSHKVRSVLAELQFDYGSNQYAGPTAYENYSPEYLRLRLRSDAAKNSEFVSNYSGGSSVEQEGFDPLVVPTLVDHKAGLVLADSKLICLYLARAYRDLIDLLPIDLEEQIIEQIDIVDRTPHVAMLYGANPDGDTRPDDIQKRMPGIHQIKFNTIRNHMANVSSEPKLIAAYDAKLRKEEAAENFVIDDSSMNQAISLAKSLIDDLENKLSQNAGLWMFGDRFTLADIAWGVSLIRLDILMQRVFLARGVDYGMRRPLMAIGNDGTAYSTMSSISVALPITVNASSKIQKLASASLE
jgi:2,5-dichlorohydroquinone reductive dechlorinase